jgi:glycosyltransferase involved in cell wall biosynthesis
VNILYITNHLDIGGITSYVFSLAKALKAKGYNVYVASSGGDLLEDVIKEGIIYIHIPIKTKSEISPRILISYFKLSGLIKKYNIQIIHCHSRTTQVLGYFLYKRTGAAYVSTCHGFFKKRFSRRAFPCWGKNVIAISQQVREHLINDFKVDDKDISVIHNGIDIDKFKTQGQRSKIEAKQRFGLGQGPVVGIVGRLSDVKGHIYLIQAMKVALKSFPEAQLLIVGDGKMKDELAGLVKELDIGKNVIFMPSARDTSVMLSAMDIFVMPSLKEGLGLSLMEAMAAGLPVIGSDVGGIKSLIQHDVNGLLVEPADVEGLSSGILELLNDQEKAKALGQRARDFIARNFSLEQMVINTERVYSRCVSA